MRIIERQDFTLSADQLLICDPMHVFEFTEREDPPYFDVPEDVLVITTVVGDGTFNVFQRGTDLVIDTAPSLFKGNSRADFIKLPKSIDVDSGTICFAGATPGRIAPMCDDIELGFVTCAIPRGRYKVWIEEKETSGAFARTIIGFGEKEKLYLHGPNADTIQELEKEAAAVLRMHGTERHGKMEELKGRILDLHWSGNNDRRLHMLASALRMKLPARRKKRGRDD